MNKYVGIFSPDQIKELSETTDNWTFWNSIQTDGHFYGKNPKDDFRISSRSYEGLVHITKIWAIK